MEDNQRLKEFDAAHEAEKERKEEEMREMVRDTEIMRPFFEENPEGFKTFMKYVNRHLEWCHRRCFDRQRMPEDPVQRLVDTEVYMLSYLELRYITELPKRLLEKGEKSLERLVEIQKDKKATTAALEEKQDPIMRR